MREEEKLSCRLRAMYGIDRDSGNPLNAGALPGRQRKPVAAVDLWESWLKGPGCSSNE